MSKEKPDLATIMIDFFDKVIEAATVQKEIILKKIEK